MMQSYPSKYHTALVALTLFICTSCTPFGPFDQKDPLTSLSDLILQPDYTCDQLRKQFGVTYLPLADNPAEIDLNYEEHWLEIDAETLLRLWYLPTNLNRGTVVYSCGNTGPMACYLYTADLLTANGWSVIMYEYEGYGLSDGEPSLSALIRDLDAVLKWTTEYTGRKQVTLMGMSLGSVPSVSIAVEHPNMVNAVILDSPIALAAQIERFAYVVGGHTSELIQQLDIELLSDVLIARLKQPLLIFLHERDILATPETVEVLYNRAIGPKTVIRFPELGHALSQFMKTDVYLYHLDTFLTEVWSERP